MSAREIRTAALKFFSEKGYDATTLADIASEIGIKKPSVYAHYTSKMDLFHTILEEVKNEYLQCWSKALADTASLPVDKRLKSIFFTVADYFLSNRENLHYWVRICLFPPKDCDDAILLPIQEANKKLIDEVAAIFQQGIEEGLFIPESSIELAHVYFCILDGYLSRVISYPAFDYHKSLSIMWNTFLLSPLKSTAK